MVSGEGFIGLYSKPPPLGDFSVKHVKCHLQKRLLFLFIGINYFPVLYSIEKQFETISNEIHTQ